MRYLALVPGVSGETGTRDWAASRFYFDDAVMSISSCCAPGRWCRLIPSMCNSSGRLASRWLGEGRIPPAHCERR
jgi:hypothetical protein